MFNFDEPRYEKVVSDALALRPQIEAAVDKVCEQGYSNIFFIGCGGTWAHTPDEVLGRDHHGRRRRPLRDRR